MTYIDVPIETEPVDLAQEAFEYLQAQVNGWQPSPGNLEAWLIEALALIASELRTMAALVPDSIFMFYGETILGIPPYAAVQATGSTTWTAVDAAGYTVEAGTLVAISPPAQSLAFAFQVVNTFSIPAGATSAGGVEVQALDAGAAQSGITGTVEVIDPLDFITTVVLEGATSGGSDAETTDHYLSRLSDLFTLLSPRPILPQDFAVLAKNTVPAVGRAVAIDLYNLDTGQTNVPRCVTVIVVDDQGQPLSSSNKQLVQDALEREREVNFLVFVGDPTYETIDVTVDVKVFPGYDPASVAAQVEADLNAWLSPMNWGLPPFGDTSAQSWLNDTVVRYLEVAEQVNRTDGVWYIISLGIAKQGNALAQADVPLTGVAPLPQAGTINATGTA